MRPRCLATARTHASLFACRAALVKRVVRLLLACDMYVLQVISGEDVDEGNAAFAPREGEKWLISGMVGASDGRASGYRLP